MFIIYFTSLNLLFFLSTDHKSAILRSTTEIGHTKKVRVFPIPASYGRLDFIFAKLHARPESMFAMYCAGVLLGWLYYNCVIQVYTTDNILLYL